MTTPLIIAHRINTVAELTQVPATMGVEIDLRDRENGIVLQHDPYLGGELLEDFLSRYCHDLLILNVKSERVEFRAIELLEKYKIPRYFFLDSSFTMIHHFTAAGNRNFALRLSEYESIETILAMRGRLDWVWVDSINSMPLTPEIYAVLRKNSFKLCFASPELLGRPHDLESYRRMLWEKNMIPDAVCTKRANARLWGAS